MKSLAELQALRDSMKGKIGCDSAGSHTHNHTDISFRVIANADFAFHGIAKSLKLC